MFVLHENYDVNKQVTHPTLISILLDHKASLYSNLISYWSWKNASYCIFNYLFHIFFLLSAYSESLTSKIAVLNSIPQIYPSEMPLFLFYFLKVLYILLKFPFNDWYALSAWWCLNNILRFFFCNNHYLSPFLFWPSLLESM